MSVGPPSNIHEWLARRLSELETSYRDGNLGALYEAVRYCGKYDEPLPKWATDGVARSMMALMELSSEAKLGQHAKWATQFIQDMVDYCRWDTVVEVREHAIRWLDAYGAAAEILNGSRATGSADAVEKSYKRVQKRMRSEPGRYRLFRYIQFDLWPNGEPNRPAMWARLRALSRDEDLRTLNYRSEKE
jgi:hypothetical protein